MYNKIYLKEGKDKHIHIGHPWIFSGAILKTTPKTKNGDIVSIVNFAKEEVGIGFFNQKNSISLRVISLNKNDIINKEFFLTKIKSLKNLKQSLLPENTNSFRLVNADSDFLPGLIIDVYNNIAVYQINILGMSNFDSIINAVLIELGFDAIVSKNDSSSRKQEGLQIEESIIKYNPKNLDLTNIIFKENGINLISDPIYGQKTGFFLDQIQTRKSIQSLSKNKTVLNLFCYSGASSIYALSGGAKSVVSLDSSDKALELLNKNLQINNIDINKHQSIQQDAFDYLNNLTDTFDIIVLDPPAFCKHKDSINRAKTAYSKINSKCLSKLKKNGILITSSCSSLIKLEDFMQIIKIASYSESRILQILSIHLHNQDHTNLVGFKEGEYLKTVILRVLN
jgi:23S rRNA (cytosine1962-C5)-methyltransferase